MKDPFLPLNQNLRDRTAIDPDELFGECFELLVKLTQHKYSVKLLLGVRLQLRMFLGYKSGRVHRTITDKEKVTQRLMNK
jgi:hypothetical protein